MSKPRIRTECGKLSELTRDGTAEVVLRDQIVMHERGQGNIHFPGTGKIPFSLFS